MAIIVTITHNTSCKKASNTKQHLGMSTYCGWGGREIQETDQWSFDSLLASMADDLYGGNSFRFFVIAGPSACGLIALVQTVTC